MTPRPVPLLPVVFLMGATAAGKTDLAACLVDHGVDAELVSVDAAQVYRGMDIGTGKPAPAFLRRYPHHLIDIRNPDEGYSAAQFCADALGLIRQIHARGKLPLLVGGTMFYFAALENGLNALPAADPRIRAQIAREISAVGLATLHAQLAQIDPQIGLRIASSDTQRIQRALEIHRVTGQPPSAVMASATHPLPFPLIKIGLFSANRKELHGRIATRFRAMLAQGLVEEVATLAASMANKTIAATQQPNMRTVGYRQVHGYLQNAYGYDDMANKAIAATRQLAKRQLTWLRQQRDLVWVQSGDSAADCVGTYLNRQLATLDARD